VSRCELNSLTGDEVCADLERRGRMTQNARSTRAHRFAGVPMQKSGVCES